MARAPDWALSVNSATLDFLLRESRIYLYDLIIMIINNNNNNNNNNGNNNYILYGTFTKLNAPYNDLQTEDKIKIPI